MNVRLSAFVFFVFICLPFSGACAAASSNDDHIRELQALMQQPNLVELRSTFNGSYGASLLLDQETLTYYVASFQHKNFFRVFKNRSEANAENNYRKLSVWSEGKGKEEVAGMKKAAKQSRPLISKF